VVAKILHGFGCKLVAFDPYPDIELTRTCHVNYVSLEQLCGTSDIITLHAPLNEGTRNLINKGVIDEMKTGVMLINTASGRLVNTSDVCDALQTKRLGFFGADVYAYGKGVMFFNQPSAMAEDLLLAQLLKMPNVIITPHTAFATTETLEVIAATSFYNINCWHTNQQSPNELTKTRGNFPSQTH
jgi:D-lactate dehydrogenase